jgi:hypothetical protein
MPTLSLVTTVFVSKAEALGIFSDTLGVPWILDDPTDVTIALGGGVVLTIEVPHFGEDLPLTLDLHHEDAEVLARVTEAFAGRLQSELGWGTTTVALGQ